MRLGAIRVLTATLAILAAGVCALPAAAAGLQALSSSDQRHYAAAFEASRSGDFDAARASLSRVTDKSLAGYVQFEKLMHPSAYTASFDELKAWLADYGDLPVAERVFNLANRRKPARARPLPAPAAVAANREVERQGVAIAGAPSPAAREAFYSGDAAKAWRLAANSGERWVAGLAAFRLQNYADAEERFAAIANDGAEDDWLRSGGAFWAARAVSADGRPQDASAYLTAAARTPWTFYGLLAESQLGLEPAARFDAPAYTPPPAPASEDPIAGLLLRISTRPATGEASSAGLARLVRTDARAKRAAALAQLGRIVESTQELMVGLASARDEAERREWTVLAQTLNLPAAPPKPGAQGRFDPADYPAPPLEPKDGFTLSPALVYAIVRQESRFNPQAVSPVGAVGLMQLMPEAAARAAGDDKLKTDMTPLYDPAFNLRVGQDYFTWLLQRGVGDDIVRAVAAYNGGPGTLQRTESQLGEGADLLMLIESLPALETRAYVERVMAGYWLYRRQFGQESPSLQALASGAARIPLSLDN